MRKIASLPMSQEFGWNSATVGLIKSSSFGGYLLTQIVAGIWADKIGGKLVLGFGLIWWSISTVLTPIASKTRASLFACHVRIHGDWGTGNLMPGVAMPAMNESSLSGSLRLREADPSLLVYSGMYLGSVTGLAFSPVLIHKFGWPYPFYSFGSLGSIRFALWLPKVLDQISELSRLAFTGSRDDVFKVAVARYIIGTLVWNFFTIGEL